MKRICRKVYREVEECYEVDIDEELVKKCKDYLASVLVENEKEIEINERLIESLYSYNSESEINQPIKVKHCYYIFETTIRDELLDFLDGYLYDFYIGEGDCAVNEVITEVKE